MGRNRIAAACAAAVVGVSGLAVSACGSGGSADTLTIYSGRNKEFVGPLLEQFAEENDVKIEVRYGDTPALAAQILEEGEASPADVFFGQDAGSLGAVDEAGLLGQIPKESLDKVDPRFRADDGKWVGTSGRSRVIVYNTDELHEPQVPNSVFDLTQPQWKGKVGIAPTNASFLSFVSAMIITEGEQRTQEWLAGMKANEAKTFPNNLQIVEAVAAGEIPLGLVNHYYLYTIERERGPVDAENHFIESEDPGALLNVAGLGIMRTSDSKDLADRFVAFMLSKESQEAVVEETDEYPLVEGVDPPGGVPPLSEIQGPQIDLSELGAQLPTTLRLLKETGLR